MHRPNLSFLKDAPVARRNEEDFRLQREAAAAVLPSTEQRSKRSWRNEKSGNSGIITLLSRSTVAERPPPPDMSRHSSGRTQSSDHWLGRLHRRACDGVEYVDGFTLTRAPNTTPVIVLRFEADNEAALRHPGRFPAGHSQGKAERGNALLAAHLKLAQHRPLI